MKLKLVSSKLPEPSYYEEFKRIVHTPKEAWIKDLYDKVWGTSKTENAQKEIKSCKSEQAHQHPQCGETPDE